MKRANTALFKNINRCVFQHFRFISGSRMSSSVLDKDKEYGGRRGKLNLGTAGVYAFDHICFGIDNLKNASMLMQSRLGGLPHEGGYNTGFDGCDWTYPNGGKLEALSPKGENSFLERFLEKSGPSIHHVTFMVNDLKKAKQAAEDLGYKVVGYDDRSPSWREFFLFPKDALGIVVQLAEQEFGAPPSNVGAYWTTTFEFPEVPKSSENRAVDILGIRLSCQENEVKKSIQQWGTLIGGTYQEIKGDNGGRQLHFSYSGSPMYVKVDITNTRPTGPIAVEIRRLPEDKLAVST